MERHRLGEDEAFKVLRAHARGSRRKLSEVADDLVRAAESLNAALGSTAARRVKGDST